jgi:hypothetical protein
MSNEWDGETTEIEKRWRERKADLDAERIKHALIYTPDTWDAPDG